MNDQVLPLDILKKSRSATLTLPGGLAEQLFSHLFPGDGDEHGAVIGAGIARSADGQLRLLAREVAIARDGIDYVPGQRGYRMLTGQFVTERIVHCRDRRLVYLAVHNHGGTNRVAFSHDDLASQRRGYPALLDIMNGMPVGALVFSKQAAAGQLWFSADHQLELDEVRLIGPSIVRLVPDPLPLPSLRAPAYDRQARLFGDRGQDLLRKCTVGVIGAGGAGSLVIEYLGRLGVGHFVVIDPERMDPTNVPRVTGSTNWDAMSWLRSHRQPKWLRRLGERLATPKVRVMRRLIRRANPNAEVVALMSDFVDDAVAEPSLGATSLCWQRTVCTRVLCSIQSCTPISSRAYKSGRRCRSTRPRATSAQCSRSADQSRLLLVVSGVMD